MTDTTYIGSSDPQQCDYSVSICNGGTVLPLPPRFDLRNHSPDGFAWGYDGSGPAQLALALIADATGKDQLALKYYQRFKTERIRRLPKDWQMPIRSVSLWVQQQEAMGPRENPSKAIFRDHNCWKCHDGELPCAERDYDRCSYPHARND